MKTRQKSGFFDACFRALTALKSLGVISVPVQIRSAAPKNGHPFGRPFFGMKTELKVCSVKRIFPVQRIYAVRIFFGFLVLSEIERLGSFGDLLFLFFRKFCGHFDRNADIQVSRAAARFDPLPADGKRRAGLRPLRDLIIERIIEVGNLDGAAERRRLERDGQIDVQVHIFALEDLVRLNADDDDQIAGRAAVRPRLTVSALADIRIGIRPCGDVQRELRLATDIPLPLAVGALVGDDLSSAAAVGACAHPHGSAEHRFLRIADLPFPAALGAGTERSAVFRTRAVTARARLVAEIGDLPCAPLCSVHKTERERELDIVAGGIALDGRAAAEALKDTVENISEPAEAAKARAAAHASHTSHAGMFLFIVVRGTFLLIGEDFVRLVDLLKFFRGELIVGVKIGVVLFDQLFIRRLDLLLRRCFAHAEDLVIVFLFCHNIPL